MDDLLFDFINTWNENNPTERLSPHVISQVSTYLNMAKSIGYDMAMNEFKRNVELLGIRRGSIMIDRLFELLKSKNRVLFRAEAKDLKTGEECWLKDYNTPFIVLEKEEGFVKVQHKRNSQIKRLSPGWPVLHENKKNAKTLGLE